MAPEPKVPKNIFSPTLSIDDIDEEELARQLSLLHFDMYKAITVPPTLYPLLLWVTVASHPSYWVKVG
jgi:hypothetical protein